MNALSTLAGFSNPVDDAQTVFRAILQAFSRPGIPVETLIKWQPGNTEFFRLARREGISRRGLTSSIPPLTGKTGQRGSNGINQRSLVSLPVPPPSSGCGSLSQGMLALALTLCDSDTPLWLDTGAETPEVRRHLRFHCSVPFATHTAGAAFAFISLPEKMPRLNAFHLGRADFPDRSTTLVIRANLSAAEPVMELTGPGVKGNDHGIWQPFHIGGLPSWFWADWAENHAAYPLGVDVVFVDTETALSGEPLVSILGLPRTIRVRPVADSPLVLSTKECDACM